MGTKVAGEVDKYQVIYLGEKHQNHACMMLDSSTLMERDVSQQISEWKLGRAGRDMSPDIPNTAAGSAGATRGVD